MHARLLSVIHIDGAGYIISFRTENLIIMDASRSGPIGSRPARSLDEIGQLSLENRPFNLVPVIALAIERRGDLRESRDATRSRQLKRAFHGGHLLIHAARLI